MSLMARLCNVSIEEEKKNIFQCCICVSSHSWLKRRACEYASGHRENYSFWADKRKRWHTQFRYLISNSIVLDWIRQSFLQILCIHLKRFRHELMFSTKIGTHVSFPLEGLDLQPFLAKDSPAQIVTYDLLSVICHHGTASSEYDCFVFAAGTSALFFKGDNCILKGK